MSPPVCAVCRCCNRDCDAPTYRDGCVYALHIGLLDKYFYCLFAEGLDVRFFERLTVFQLLDPSVELRHGACTPTRLEVGCARCLLIIMYGKIAAHFSFDTHANRHQLGRLHQSAAIGDTPKSVLFALSYSLCSARVTYGCSAKTKRHRQPRAYWPMAEVDTTRVTPTPSSTTTRPALLRRELLYNVNNPCPHIPCDQALGAELVLITRLRPDVRGVDGRVTVDVCTLQNDVRMLLHIHSESYNISSTYVFVGKLVHAKSAPCGCAA